MASMRRLAEMLGLCPRGFLSNGNEMQRTVSHRYSGLSVPENGCKTGTGLKYKKVIIKKEDKRKKGLHLITVIISQHLQIVKQFYNLQILFLKKVLCVLVQNRAKTRIFEHRSNFCQLDVLMRKSVISIEKILTFLVKSIAISVKLCYTSSV